MGPKYMVCCLLVLCSFSQSKLMNQRGAELVDHGYNSDECYRERNWPLCRNDEWGPRCPSGCRIQALLDQADQQLESKINKIQKFLVDRRKDYHSTDEVTKQTYDFLRERLLAYSANNDRYMHLAGHLRQRIDTIKRQVDQQYSLLQAMNSLVQDQVEETQRLEVDAEIKLRSCKGSCASTVDFSMDRESYRTLGKHLAQPSLAGQGKGPAGPLRVLRSRPVTDTVAPSMPKAGVAAGGSQQQGFFTGVRQLQLFLETVDNHSISSATGATAACTDCTAEGQDLEARETSPQVKLKLAVDSPLEKVAENGGGANSAGLGDTSKKRKDTTAEGERLRVTADTFGLSGYHADLDEEAYIREYLGIIRRQAQQRGTPSRE
ncbi:fibrinogen alpha chain-like [Megalops cyprinoides]|uniref:fibrinogen alpha chain-like n=1 Tax=Megalops cyprinoides TaxID=118141 RepID=UPI0018642348|nr:fibrinogen alpha chain-like [Megalops cyprinoides]